LIGKTESQVIVAGIRFSCEDKIKMDVEEIG
jgi:hypothetical protein